MFKKLQRTLDRKKQGKVPFKLRFIVHVQQISGLPAIFKQARVQWTRGAKVAMTNTVPVHDGVADFNEKLVQIATVYRDARNKIDPKEYSMKVQVPSKSDPSKMVSLGKVQMDIVSFIDFDGEVQAAKLDVPFKLGEKGKLRFAVSSEVVQDGMDVDGMTEATGVTGLSSGFSEDLHQDLSGFEDAHTSSTHLHDHYQDRSGSMRSSGTGASSSAARPPVAPRPPKAAAAADMEAELKKAREEAELLRAQLELLQAGDEEPPQARPQGGRGGPSAEEWLELQEQCDDLEEELRQSRRSEAELQRQVAQLTAQLQAAASAQDRTGGESAVPSGASTLEHRSGSLEDAATLQRQLEEARLELAQLTADRARLQEQLGLVREEVEELKRQNDSLNDSLHHQSSRQEELRSELASASAQVASVGVREAEAEAMVQRLELQLREQSEEASRYQAEAEVARRELAAEAAEREVLQRSLMDASSSSSAVQDSSALAVTQVVEAATAAKERRLAVLEEELDREREGMQKQLLDSRHTILQLETKLEQAAKQLMALEDEELERQDLRQQRQGGQGATWGSQEALERAHAENEQMAEELVRVKLALAQRVDEELVLKRELHRTKEKAITYAQRATKWETAFYSKGRSQSGGWKWSVSGS